MKKDGFEFRKDGCGFSFDLDWVGLVVIILVLGFVCTGRSSCDERLDPLKTCSTLADDCQQSCRADSVADDGACVRACMDTYSICVQRIRQDTPPEPPDAIPAEVATPDAEDANGGDT